MSPHPMRRRIAAFTLVELMIVVALVAVILALAAPSFRDMILMQRLRGVNAQLVTDLALARAEAISRATFVQLRFQSSAAGSCYIMYTRSNALTAPQCDCTANAGLRCSDASIAEVRTVELPAAESIEIAPSPGGAGFFTLSPRTGGIVIPPSDEGVVVVPTFVMDTYIDNARKFRNVVGQSGRVSVCAPAGSRVGGEAC